MGYRSDVAISVYQKDFNELCNRIKNHTIENADTRSELASLLKWATIDIIQDEDDHDKSIVTLIFGSIKWYEGFKDIDYLMALLHEDGRCYSFKRIGESSDDYEEECDDSYELNDVTYFERYFGRWCQGDVISNNEKNNLLGLEDDTKDGESVDAGMNFDDIGG